MGRGKGAVSEEVLAKEVGRGSRGAEVCEGRETMFGCAGRGKTGLVFGDKVASSRSGNLSHNEFAILQELGLRGASPWWFVRQLLIRCR